MAEDLFLNFDEDKRGGSHIADLLMENKGDLIGTDPKWGIQHGCYQSLASDDTGGRYVTKAMALFPTPEIPVTFQAAHLALTTLKASPLGRYGVRTVSSNLATIISWVASGAQRVMIKMPKAETNLPKQAKARFTNFIRVTVPGAAGSAGQKDLVGRLALEHIYAGVVAKSSRRQKITLGDLTDLSVFNYLLIPEERQRVATWTDLSLTSKTTGSATITPKSSSADVSDYYFEK